LRVPKNKPLPAATKKARGTLRAHRQLGVIEIVAPGSPPIMPSWLTKSGEAVWLDNVGRAMQLGLVAEADSDLFASWCCLIGAIGDAWGSGGAPPGWAVTESRRLGELFGLAGARSRIVRGLEPGPERGERFPEIQASARVNVIVGAVIADRPPSYGALCVGSPEQPRDRRGGCGARCLSRRA
jgi:hypothetical protein